MLPPIDLVLTFKGISPSLSKQQVADEFRNAKAEYKRVMDTLSEGGLKATGRRGQRQGQLLILVWAPPRKLVQLVQKERHSDFLLGLPTPLPGRSDDLATSPLAPADRLRLVHGYVTSLKAEGGLGIVPGLQEWRRVESVMALHDQTFDQTWIHHWTRQQVGFRMDFKELDKIRDQFGESVALYFAFLTSYTQALFIPSVIGVTFWAFSSHYSPWYSGFISLWSICWVEWWRVRERVLSAHWGTLGSFRVERRRPEFRGSHGNSGQESEKQAFPWWQRDIRILFSLPVILLFAGILAVILTAIFVFEAFVAQLYQGPLHEYISLAPTFLFAALVPRVLALYQSFALMLTNWENHAHRSTHDASLTIKTFSLSAIVAYLGLALTAFVYAPFGQFVMGAVQTQFVNNMNNVSIKVLFESNVLAAQTKIDPERRLSSQMFAYLVTNQVTDTFVEILLPYIMRGVDDIRNGKSIGSKKRVDFAGEKANEKEERIFMEGVRHQASLPSYSLFDDYAEMVTQFGYVALWSTIWPLAPAMAFINNWLELRSDAFKIITHVRRPLPVRVDTIGPWLESLGTISWLGALTNAALVYLFRLRDANIFSAGHAPGVTWHNLLVPALLIALSSSHCYLLVRRIVQHLMERAVWQGSDEMRTLQSRQDEVKRLFLKGVQQDDEITDPEITKMAQDGQDHGEFWDKEEGIEELHQVVKVA